MGYAVGTRVGKTVGTRVGTTVGIGVIGNKHPENIDAFMGVKFQLKSNNGEEEGDGDI